jgi:hypothetical protein
MAAEAVSAAHMSQRSTRRSSAMTTLQVRAEGIREGELERHTVRDVMPSARRKPRERERSP